MELSILEVIEKTRKELHEYIEKYDLVDSRTVSKSQELDRLLNIYGKGQVCA